MNSKPVQSAGLPKAPDQQDPKASTKGLKENEIRQITRAEDAKDKLEVEHDDFVAELEEGEELAESSTVDKVATANRA
jgi:hypothetical protein